MHVGYYNKIHWKKRKSQMAVIIPMRMKHNQGNVNGI